MLLIGVIFSAFCILDISCDEKGCILPPEPFGGSYEILDCRPGERSAKCRKVPGTEVDSFTALLYSCDEGEISSGQEKTTYCNLSGKWIPDIKRLLRCSTVVSPTDPACGIRNNLPFGGDPAREYTWHASIYREDGRGRNLICSGAILSDRAVITAAHCVYNESTNTAVPTNDLWVAVGKFHKSWDIVDPNEQRLKVLEIIIRNTFLGNKNRYEHDIAVLFLAAVIIINPTVMPVCIDREHSFPVKNFSNGTVLSWGRAESGGVSDTLGVAKLPFYGFDICHDLVSPSFAPYIPYDKFCAGLHNDTHTANFISGGGLTFSPGTTNNKEIHFLQGVASVRDVSDNKITAFTNVTIHLPWLDRVLKEMENSRRKPIINS